MYLSRAELDATRRNTMIALASPQKFHGAVESAFPGGRRRRLWRLDTLNGKLYLLLLSEDVPDLTGLCAQFGTGAAPETRAYEPLLERVTPGSCWQFRLTANPTRSQKNPADPLARGTLKPCYLDVEQEEWLLEQAEKEGAALVTQAEAAVRQADRDAAVQTERQAAALREQMLAETEQQCAKMRSAAMAKMDNAVAYIAEKVVKQ